MSAEQNKSIIRRWVESGWNGGNLALVDEIYATNFIQYEASSPQGMVGTEALKQYVAGYRHAMPDIHFSIDHLIAEGDDVAWHFTAKGTQQGELMGIPPTGKSSAVTGIVIFHFSGGKVSTVWVNFDTLGMLQQLGVIPTPNA